MNSVNIEEIDRKYGIFLSMASVALLTVLLCAWMKDSVATQWQHAQRDYDKLLWKKATSEQEKLAAKNYEVKLRQLVVPKLGVVDRCISCHQGLEDPRMATAPQPHRTHPGKYLRQHDPYKMGCTVCHDGQGRALSMHDVRGEEHWEKPLLPRPYIEATCARCHEGDVPKIASRYQRGQILFKSNGCLGCHKLNGIGGELGPDISDLGNASFHMKKPLAATMAKLKLENNPAAKNPNIAYIIESITNPKANADNSLMLNYHFTRSELEALAVYLKSMTAYTDKTIPDSLKPPVRPVKRKLSPVLEGHELFGKFCIGCHGKKGQSNISSEVTLQKSIPDIGNPQFLSISGEDMLFRLIKYSRGSKLMPAWGKAGGLNDSQIHSIAAYLMSLRRPAPSMEEISAIEGSAEYGHAIYRGNCYSCHGYGTTHEKDMIGPSLFSREFMGHVSDEMLYGIITSGRKNTAMPSWSFLCAENLADLLAYFRLARDRKPDLAGFTQALAKADEKYGAVMFNRYCVGCHSGAMDSIAPSLFSREFLQTTPQRDIYLTLAKGREGTAMGSWNKLGIRALGDIVRYIKSRQTNANKNIPSDRIFGSEYTGAKLYARICAQCHGDQGQGGIGPAIGSRGFLESRKDGFIYETIAYGRSSTAMKANLLGQNGMVELSERQIQGLVAFLRAKQDDPAVVAGIRIMQGDAVLGEKLFARMCAQCHGPRGEGGNGPGIRRKAFLGQVSDGYLASMIVNGRSGTGMRGFSTSNEEIAGLNSREVRALVSYLRDGQNKTLPFSIVTGNVTSGEKLYMESCSKCHGIPDHDGFAPELWNAPLLKAAGPAFLQATMSLGKSNTQMQPVMIGGHGVVELTSQEANDIVAFLQSKVKKEKNHE